MARKNTAAIVTVGSELVEGLRVDANTAHIARRVANLGFAVVEAVSVGDNVDHLSSTIHRLSGAYGLVIVTGGLGPTHDDVTREAAGVALDLELREDPEVVLWLSEVAMRHNDPDSRREVLKQALVLSGAEILWPMTGTAPGQILDTPGGRLVLLPGPPAEMAEMLERALAGYEAVTADPRELGVVGMAESDVQHAAQRGLRGHSGVVLTVLAKPGEVRGVLMDDGAGTAGLQRAVDAVADEIGVACYTRTGQSLAESTLDALRSENITLAFAESCTGGLMSSALTEIPGASLVFRGAVVSYANEVKRDILGVPGSLLDEFGAVSEQVAVAMAEGVRARLDADIAVSVTGVAGPAGGSTDKPVGLVWFAVADSSGTRTCSRHFVRGARDSIRARAASTALDLARRHVLGV